MYWVVAKLIARGSSQAVNAMRSTQKSGGQDGKGRSRKLNLQRPLDLGSSALALPEEPTNRFHVNSICSCHLRDTRTTGRSHCILKRTFTFFEIIICPFFSLFPV